MTPPGGSEKNEEVTLAGLSAKLDYVVEKIEPVAQLCSVVAVLNNQVAGPFGVLEKIEDYGKRIVGLENSVKPWIKAMGVLAVLLAGTLIAFVWSIITHQVTIVVP